MKLKTLFYIVAALTIAATSCGDSDDKKATPPANVADTTAVDETADLDFPDTAFSTETIDTFSTLAFTGHAKKQANNFDWSRFRMEQNWTEDTLLVTNYKPDKKFYDAYGRFVKYSPDSSMFIDMDSYSVQIKKDSKGQWQGTELEPDSEISLVNLQTGKKSRLLFLGPGRSVEDAMWLDKDNLALIGVEDNGDSTGKVAAVWKINIPTKSYYLYELKDSIAARRILGTWRKERLKGVVMN